MYKKVLDFMGVASVEERGDVNPLFSWTANLIIVNRRKTLVVMNDKTKISFVLYGVTTKSIPKMQNLIFDGIRAMMESEYISEKIIEKYLDDCTNNITFSKTASRSLITYCNQACERVRLLENVFETNDMFQKKLLPWINDNPIALENFYLPVDAFVSSLKEIYGDPVQCANMVELEVTLNLLTPCKRTIVVPSNLNFYQLHRIMQDIFEWRDCHYHQFVLKRDDRGVALDIIQPLWMQDEDYAYFDKRIQYIDNEEITICEVFEKQNQIEYEYDFGDGWTHTIKLIKFIENCDNPYSRCTELVGVAPMDDCGGPHGFDEIMKILDNPNHPEYEDVTRWLGRTEWHSSDLKHINCMIDDVYRRPFDVTYN